MPKISVGEISVQTPKGWLDGTNEVEAEFPPFTLVKKDGVGALQFSVGLYRKGPKPNVSSKTLYELLFEFASSRQLGKPSDIKLEDNDLFLSGGSFFEGKFFTRVWYVSDGSNFVLATYTTESAEYESELQECEQIVRTIHFKE